jgi:hypothetical protein
MKHNYILCGICLLLLFSCKKDKKNPPAEKLYPVSFNITDFSQIHVPIDGGVVKAKTTTAIDTLPVTDLIFMLFNADGTALKELKRVTKTSTGFGKFTTSVAPGNYLAVFCGGPSSLKVSGDGTIGSLIGNLTVWGDTFYKKTSITVTSSAVSQNVALDRLSAQLVLNVNDAIPADVKKITVSYKDYQSIKASTGDRLVPQGVTVTNSATIVPANVGKTNYRIVMNTLNNVTPFAVTIKYFKADLNNAFATKTVTDVVCNQNVRTILSGNLFTPGNSGFTLTFDPAYNTPLTTEF